LTNEELKQTLVKLDTTETTLMQNEKMASLGELVAGVTHEINTPVGLSLTGITHFSDIARNLEKLYKDKNLSQEEFEGFIKTSNELATTITINLKKAADIIRNFKTVAIDQTNIEKRDFNVKQYTKQILLSLRNKTKQLNIDFQIECDDDLVIHSIPGFYSQILTNFIMNSIIHGFEDIKNGIIKITVTKVDKSLHVEYEDNGKGISDENLSSVFQPFFTTKKHKGGSGLGLNIIYKIVTEQLHGKITCKSSENKGVKFDINFPI
jgi:signal transduction histidine kinase